MKNKHLSFNTLFIALFCIALQACSTKSAEQTPQWPQQTLETKPWTRWWWHGSTVDSANLTANLEALAQAGFGGVEITPIYDVKGYEDKAIPFQSDKWMEMFAFTLKEAHRLGMEVDLANASGWPFGGNWIGAKDACKNVRYKKFTLNGGEKLKEKVEFIQKPLAKAVRKRITISDVKFPISSTKNLQKKALAQIRFKKPLPLQALMAYNAHGKIVDLTNHVNNGKLDWTAPKGKWTLYAIFQGWHGKMVERAGTRGEGNVIDHFSKDALEHFLADFDKHAKNIDMTGFRAFFNDSYEVDDGLGSADWTTKFFEEFKQRRGYNLRNYLPALLGDADEETNNRVLCDYRETISDLLLDDFTKPWAKWAESHNAIIRNQAHGSPAAVLDLYAASHIPETEGTNPMRIKMASSAGHTSGKKLIACEACTWLKEHFLSNLADVKQNADNYLGNGVNHIVYHGTPYSPADEKWPGWMFYAAVHFAPTNTWWDELKTLNSYIANCQSFMQNSTPDNDILLYFPIHDTWSEGSIKSLPHFGKKNEDLTKAISNKLLNEGYTFDYISDRQIAKLKCNGKQLEAAGATYKTIIVPQCNCIPFPTLQHLFDLAETGATVIFERNIPTKISGLKDYKKQEEKAAQLVGKLNFSGNKTKSAAYGKGTIWVGSLLETMLSQTGIEKEALIANGLGFNRVKRAEGTCYFISNWSDKTVDKWIKVQAYGKEAAWFNPMTHTLGKAQTKADGSVYTQLKPGEALILQWYNGSVVADNYPVWKTSKISKELNNEWSVSFEKGGSTLPESYKTKELKSWTEVSDELQKFSGTASYKTSFDIPENALGDYQLNLGKVHEVATVILNGKNLGLLVGPEFQVVLPATLLKNKNTLEVKVTNLMANRIIDMDKRHVNYKKFYNINFAPHLRENKDTDGTFTSKNWSPLPSGLLGPVSISRVEKK